MTLNDEDAGEEGTLCWEEDAREEEQPTRSRECRSIEEDSEKNRNLSLLIARAHFRTQMC